MSPPTSSRADLRLCGLADLDVAEGSVDAIITDPPYPRAYLPLWGDLGDLAARVLRPGGALLAMSGQAYLDEVMAHLTRAGLSYRWTICVQTPAPNVRIWQTKVWATWKPILWFTKGKESPQGWMADSIVSSNDKRFHGWGQDLSVFEQLVEQFSHVVCDPFLGGGTTAVAAVLNHRRFVGCDVDESCVETARTRLRAVDEFLDGQRARVAAS